MTRTNRSQVRKLMRGNRLVKIAFNTKKYKKDRENRLHVSTQIRAIFKSWHGQNATSHTKSSMWWLWKNH